MKPIRELRATHEINFFHEKFLEPLYGCGLLWISTVLALYAIHLSPRKFLRGRQISINDAKNMSAA